MTAPLEKIWPCGYCGVVFVARRRWQRFCSAACRKLSHREAPDLYSISAGAKELGIDRHKLRRLINKGAIRAVQVPVIKGYREVLTRGEIDRYLTAHDIES